MKNHHSTLDRARRLAVVALLIVSAASLVGCVSRKQYAINESILIGERRQLEDEIYRVQFQLRDALVENQQLREKLKNDGVDPDEYLRKNRSTPTTPNGNPLFQNYPGLNVGSTTPNAPSSLALQKAMAQNSTAPSADRAQKLASRADVAAQNARLANLVAPRAGAIRQTSAIVPQNYKREDANLEKAPTPLVAPQPVARPARLEERVAPLAQTAPERVRAYKAPVFTPREESPRAIRVPTYEEAFDRAAELDSDEVQDVSQDEEEAEEYLVPNSDDASPLDEENAQEPVEDEWAPLP